MDTTDKKTDNQEKHIKDPLHGITLQMMLEALLKVYGWDGLGEMIPVRCFTSNPSIKSSLNFLRKTPWARKRVEELYLYSLRRGKLKN